MDNIGALLHDIKMQLPDLELREQEPMSAHTSFRIGGPARVMVLPSSLDELQALCALLRAKGVSPLIIGNGTNLLVCDEPLDRFIIKLGSGFDSLERRGHSEVFALCGISLARLALSCAHWGLGGLEFAHGIPGSLGGAAFMNAGAYGGEMKDVLKSVTYIDEDACLREKTGEELELSYRHSVFSDTDSVIVGCLLSLHPDSESDILERMRALSEKRRNSQPLDKPSAGSTFKRPVGGYAAALIESAGLKGYCLGGAQVSEKHAGFVINRGGASFEDVRRLMEYIQKTVYAQSGIRLEPEVKIITN